jgi:hypothetical protein
VSGAEIKAQFAFLLERGFVLTSESDAGFAGSITYRSPDLWIAVEWDRSHPWLRFSPTHSWSEFVEWSVLDHVLRGRTGFECDTTFIQTAPTEVLVAFVQEHLPAILARFDRSNWPATLEAILRIESDRRRRGVELPPPFGKAKRRPSTST